MTVKAACYFYLKKKKKKKSGADEELCLTGSDNLCPHFKEFGGAYCVCIVRYFVRVFLRGLKHIYVLSFTPNKTI